MSRSRKTGQAVNQVKKIFEISNSYGPSMHATLYLPKEHTKLHYNAKLMPFVQKLKKTAAHYHLGYFTPNQVLSLKNLFIINKNIIDKTTRHQSYCNENDYQTYLHPEIIHYGPKTQIKETCQHFPNICAMVERSNEIVIKYKNQLKEEKEEKIEGYKAHIYQHCMSHLQGKLLIDYEVSKGRFFVERYAEELFPKSQFLLKEYSIRLKNYHEKKAKEQLSPQQQKAFQETKKDYLKRFKQAYQEEIIKTNKIARS